MTPQECLDTFRAIADDGVITIDANPNQPYLWSNAVLLAYMAEGQLEACRRAKLLLDSTTAATCDITVTNGESIYDVDPRVIEIKRVKLQSQLEPLPKCSVEDMDLFHPGWEDDPSAEPVLWIPWEDHKLMLWYTPPADDVLRLRVIREPLLPPALETAPGADDAVLLEISPRYHMGVVHWMLHRAFQHRERQDMYRPEESARYLSLFEEEFGKKYGADQEVWTQRKHGYDHYDGHR